MGTAAAQGRGYSSSCKQSARDVVPWAEGADGPIDLNGGLFTHLSLPK
jgi:hypothetical protein